jgi:hypothetical protein
MTGATTELMGHMDIMAVITVSTDLMQKPDVTTDAKIRKSVINEINCL